MNHPTYIIKFTKRLYFSLIIENTKTKETTVD